VRPRYVEPLIAPPYAQAPPQLAATAPQQAGVLAVVAPPTQSGSTLRTVAIVAGVIVLAIGAWFIRKKLVEPLFYGRKNTDVYSSSAGSGKAGGKGDSWSLGAKADLWGSSGKGAKGGGKGGGKGTFDYGVDYDEPEPRSRRAAPRVTFEELPPTRKVKPQPRADEPGRANVEAQRLVAARQSALRAMEELAGPDSEEDAGADDPNFVPL